MPSANVAEELADVEDVGEAREAGADDRDDDAGGWEVVDEVLEVGGWATVEEDDEFLETG